MAKKARDVNNIEALPSVKLFAASSGWPYKPCWSPQSPLVFFFGGAAKDPAYVSTSGHICKRAKDLLSSLLMPEHDDIFIVDLSQIASRSEWSEELQKPGRAMKMLSRWFMKFNPSAATVVAQGMDVGLIYTMIKSWTTPATSPVDHPVDKVLIVGKPPEKKMMQSISEVTKVAVVKPTAKAVAAALGRVNLFNVDAGPRKSYEDDARTPSTTDSDGDHTPITRGPRQSFGVRCNDIFFTSVEFSLDPVNKGLVQTPIDITAQVLINTAPILVPSSQEAENDLATSEKVASHHLDFGMAVRNMIVQVVDINDTGGMTHAVLSDAQGSVEALLSDAVKGMVTRGGIVGVTGHLVSIQGRLILLVEQATPHAKLHHGYMSAPMGQRNVSERVHQYGCLVLRGSKCILGRRGDYAWIPVTEPKAYESKQQAATRAIADSCRVFSEEIALVHDVPPAIAYLPDVDGNGTVVMSVFLAMASNQSSIGCDCDEPLDSEKRKRYDWYDFDQAILFVKTKAERNCILTLTSNLAAAVDAGIVIRSTSGYFGPNINAVDGDLSLHQILALADVQEPKAMLCDAKPEETPLSTKAHLPTFCPAVSPKGTKVTSLLEFEKEKEKKRLAKLEKEGEWICGGKCPPSSKCGGKC